jgi:short-subunit dehydrogenase
MDNTALITGGANGIGLELARLMAKDSYNLVLVDQRNELPDVKKDLLNINPGIEIKTIIKDLTDPDAAMKIYEELEKDKVIIDVLVNNAGFGHYGEFSETDWETELKMLKLHVINLTHMTKLFLKGMIERKKGKIMNVASMAAFQPSPLMSVYFASKAYILHFSEAIANEVKGTGVTVTVLCPGATKTGFQEIINAGMPDYADKGWVYTTPRAVAEYGYKAMNRGKVVAIHRFVNYLTANLIRFLPRNIVTNLTRMIQEKNHANYIKSN